MSPIAVLAIVVMFIGIGIRLFAWKPYLEMYVHRYHEAPPRGWLWTRDDDPFVERWRRFLVVGSIFAIGGSVGLFILAISGFA